jgi:hypothetical protein
MRNTMSYRELPIRTSQDALVRAWARRSASPTLPAVAATVAVMSLGLFWENNLLGRIFSGILISIPITYAIGNAAHIAGLSLSKGQCIALVTTMLCIASAVLYSLSTTGL